MSAARPSAVVTGAATGIGWATAKVLLERGFRVFGNVLSAADADRLRGEFGAFGDAFAPLIFDITDEAAVRTAAREVEAALDGATLTGLVNNAGVSVAGPLLHVPVQAFRRQLEVNLTGAVIVTQAFAPLLGAAGQRRRDPGRIVNISSLAGRNGIPFMGPYVASKFGLEGLSEALRRELLPFGVDVIVVAPGAVATPIWKEEPMAAGDPAYEAPIAAMQAYSRDLAPKGLPPERIGEVIHEALTTARPKVRYTVSPSPLQTLLGDWLPRRTADRLIGRRLGLLA